MPEMVEKGTYAIFFLMQKRNASLEEEPTPTGEIEGISEEVTEVTPSPTAEAVIARENISIQILNGTGIAKEASYLQGILAALGYKKIEASNAPNTNFTDTEVSFKTGISQGVKNEITKELEKVYRKVNSTTASTGTYDVKITTGLRKKGPLHTVAGLSMQTLLSRQGNSCGRS